MGWATKNHGYIAVRGKRFFLSKTSRQAVGHTQLPIQFVSESFFLWEQGGRGILSSCPCSSTLHPTTHSLIILEQVLNLRLVYHVVTLYLITFSVPFQMRFSSVMHHHCHNMKLKLDILIGTYLYLSLL